MYKLNDSGATALPKIKGKARQDKGVSHTPLLT